jgi:phosphomannomutase
MAATGAPLSELVDRLPRYAMVKHSFPIRRSAGPSNAERDQRLWRRIASRYPEAKVDDRDGLRLDWNDRWVHVRSSNTEPIVRVIAEAADPELAHGLAAEVGQKLAEDTDAVS